IDVVAVKLIQLREPEVIAGVVRIRRVIRVASQITEVLHQHEGAVKLALSESRIFAQLAKHTRPTLGGVIESGNQPVAFRGQERGAAVGVQGVYKLLVRKPSINRDKVRSAGEICRELSLVRVQLRLPVALSDDDV